MKVQPDRNTTTLRAVPGLRAHPIPCAAGHDVVYGLARGSKGEVYLAASNEFSPGLCAVVYAFNPVTGNFRTVIDIQAATGFQPSSGRMPHSKIHLCLNASRDGRAFACTHFTAPGIGQTDFEPIAAYRELFEGCCFLEYRPSEDRVENHGRLLVGEGARISCYDDVHQQYYFLSYPRNHLYRYDCRRRSLHDLGRMGQENSFGLEVDDEGNVYTSDDLGQVLVYDFVKDRLEATELFLPLPGGRRPNGNYIRRMTKAPDGCFYGFANKGGHFFRIDPKRRALTDLGVIYGRETKDEGGFVKLPPAKAITPGAGSSLLVAFGGDGIYLDDQPVPALVSYDRSSGETTELGKFIAEEEGVPAWIPQCALSAPDLGVAYFGLQQTVGGLRLWETPWSVTREARPVKNLESYHEHLGVIARQPFGASVEGANRLPFVRADQISMHELGWLGEGQVVPPGEDQIADLDFAGTTLYGVTTGRRSHLFCFRLQQQNRFTENYDVHPWDLGIVDDAVTTQAELFLDPARARLIVATYSQGGFTLRAYLPGSERQRYRGAYHSLPHWPPVQWDATPFRLLHHAKGMDVKGAVFLPASGVLLWSTALGELLAFGVGGEETVRRLLFALGPSRLIGLGDDGFVALPERGPGVRFRLSSAGELEKVSEVADLPAGVVCGAAEPSGGTLALGTQDGRVEVVSLQPAGGRQTHALRNRWPVRALAWHPNGRVYGYYGSDDGIGEAFVVEVGGKAIRHLGILQVSSQPRFWMAHRCDAIAVGPNGEVCFGEHDRISHLFTFQEATAAPVSSIS